MEFWNRLSRKIRLLFFLVFFGVFLGSGWFLYPRFLQRNSAVSEEEIIPPREVTQVTVYIAGAVRKPGVYTLSQGSRVQNAIRAAGGPGKNWDPEGINLAKLLEDEDMVVVPEKNPASPNQGMAKLPSSSSPDKYSRHKKLPFLKKISLNRADSTELKSLPGIGPEMAHRILAYRQSHGSFNSLEEVRKVPGLGRKKFERIKPYLRL